MKFLFILTVSLLSTMTAFAGANTCEMPIPLYVKGASTSVPVILQLNEQMVNVLYDQRSSEGTVPAGKYETGDDIELSVDGADCDEGLSFWVETFDEEQNQQYQITKVFVRLVCSKDSLGHYTTYKVEGDCDKGIEN